MRGRRAASFGLGVAHLEALPTHLATDDVGTSRAVDVRWTVAGEEPSPATGTTHRHRPHFVGTPQVGGGEGETTPGAEVDRNGRAKMSLSD